MLSARLVLRTEGQPWLVILLLCVALLLSARVVMKDNTKTKLVNQGAKMIVVLDRTLQLTKRHVWHAQQDFTKIKQDNRVAKTTAVRDPS